MSMKNGHSNSPASILQQGKSGHHWQIWGGAQSCHPELFFQPETTGQIKEIIDEARDRNKKVKVVGHGHSLNEIAMTTDYMVSLEKYKKVINVNKEKCQVTVEAGITMKELNTVVLPENGMAIKVQPDVDDITVGGVISMGGHGQGEHFQITSTQVIAMELMTSSGDVIVISDHENADLLPAARLSLGCLGIILTVTLQCEPAFKLHNKVYFETFDKMMSTLDTVSASADHFSYTWLPHTGGGQVSVSSKTTKENSDSFSFFKDVLVGGIMYGICLWFCTICGWLFPVVHKLYYHLIFKHPKEKVDRSDNVTREDRPNCYAIEMIVQRCKTVAAMTELRYWMLSNDGPPFPTITQLFFTKGDDVYLSSHYKEDSASILIVVPRPFNKVLPVEKTFKTFQSIMMKFGGKPHWALVKYLSSTDLAPMYPEWGKFQAIRKRLDPTGMFLNDFLEQLLEG